MVEPPAPVGIPERVRSRHPVPPLAGSSKAMPARSAPLVQVDHKLRRVRPTILPPPSLARDTFKVMQNPCAYEEVSPSHPSQQSPLSRLSSYPVQINQPPALPFSQVDRRTSAPSLVAHFDLNPALVRHAPLRPVPIMPRPLKRSAKTRPRWKREADEDAGAARALLRVRLWLGLGWLFGSGA